MLRRIAVLLAVQLVLFALLAEAGLRLFAHYYDNLNVLLYNPYALPAYGEINSLEELLKASPAGFHPFSRGRSFVASSKSFNTAEYTVARPAGVQRVLAIGDSFTDTSGDVPYASLWPLVLQQRMSAQDGTVEVIKLGVSGVGPRFELRLWQLEGRKLGAAVVILGFCIGNDFTDEQNLGGIYRHGVREQAIEYSYLARLVRNLFLIGTGLGGDSQLLVQGAAQPEAGRGGYPLDSHYDPEQPTFDRAAYYKVVRQRMDITYRPARPRFDYRFAALQPVLLAFRDEVRSSGARFVIMLIPDEYQVYPELVTEVLRGDRLRPQDFDPDLPQRELAAFLAGNGIEYLDLLPVFRQAAAATKLYRKQDSHWNIEGNRLAAETLFAYLQGQRNPAQDLH